MTDTQVKHYETALQIAQVVQAEHTTFLAQVHAEKEKNPIFAKALAAYGGMEMFSNFRFQCFDKQAVGLGKERLFGDVGIGGYLEANKDKVVLEEFNVIQVTLGVRFQNIVQAIQKITDADTALESIRILNGSLILPTVNTMPALS